MAHWHHVNTRNFGVEIWTPTPPYKNKYPPTSHPPNATNNTIHHHNSMYYGTLAPRLCALLDFLVVNIIAVVVPRVLHLIGRRLPLPSVRAHLCNSKRRAVWLVKLS